MSKCKSIHYCQDTDVLFINLREELCVVESDSNFRPLYICETYTMDGLRAGYEIIDFKREYDNGRIKGLELEECDFENDILPRVMALIENGVSFEDELPPEKANA